MSELVDKPKQQRKSKKMVRKVHEDLHSVLSE